MSSKSKKGNKKKIKNNSEGTCPRNALPSKKVHTYFTNHEIGDLKSILKTKDITGVPLVVRATILSRTDILKNLLEDGYNINESGQNNITALWWAVQHKHLDAIEFLLMNGADPTLKNHRGADVNILLTTLEHKFWDEDSYIALWNLLKKRISFIDLNMKNRDGHSMLYILVKRKWKRLLRMIMLEKVNASKVSGVTTLMTACFQINPSIIDQLIEAGADILEEDHFRRMTLCCVISAANKIERFPTVTPKRIFSELEQKCYSAIYLKTRLNMIAGYFPFESQVASDILTKIVHLYAAQFMEDINDGVFAQLAEAMKICLKNPTVTKFILEIVDQLRSYKEYSIGYSSYVQNGMTRAFQQSGIPEICTDIAKKNKDAESSKAPSAGLPVLTYPSEIPAIETLDRKLLRIKDAPTIDVHLQESLRTTFKHNKKKKRSLIDAIEISNEKIEELKEEKKKLEAGVGGTTKKSKRRAKAIKAKLTKMKSAELTKRLMLNGKRCSQQKIGKIMMQQRKDENMSPSPVKHTEELFSKNNPIVSALQQFLNNDDGTKFYNFTWSENDPKWKQKVYQLPFTDFSHFTKTLCVDYKKISEAVGKLKAAAITNTYEPNLNFSLSVVKDYLKILLQMIVRKYREYWDSDTFQGYCSCHEVQEHVPWLYNRHLSNLEVVEKQLVGEVLNHFNQLIYMIKDLATKNMAECYKQINKIENTLLNYEIRSIKVLSYNCSMETLTMRYCTKNFTLIKEPNLTISHAQDVLNNLTPQRDDVEIEMFDEVDDPAFIEEYASETPAELYYNEMNLLSPSKPKNKRKEIESKLNTIANGFHLINSTMAICDNDDDNSERSRRSYRISDLNHPFKAKSTKSPQYSEYMPNRLKSQIASLQNSQCFQRLLEGEVRICTKEQRVSYIISAGINFSAVELGLDVNNQPLAVKRIPRQSWLGKIIKTLVDPLLGLINKNILHYFACECEDNELILATPLCKWNLAQYVQIIRQQGSVIAMPGLTAMQVVRQFLDGLNALHKCDIPIVHGNLKPSNIFVDFNGLVKVAEFGIHKALYKVIEVPKSSLIWFAKETLEMYKNSSILDCTTMTDVQVAGMLLYFILCYGKHPFGDDPEEILRNIQKNTPKLNVRNADLRDLLLWMMVDDPNQSRPTVEQVLSHTFFWSVSKKWIFILCCAGINQSGYILPVNIDKLHRSIDTFSAGFVNIEWQEAIINKFPSFRLNNESNTLVGLLKFIKHCYGQRVDCSLSDEELSCLFLSAVPALPAVLYRTLQNTNWLRHGVFLSFLNDN